MSIADHEQRIRALEAAMIELKSEAPQHEESRNAVVLETDRPLVPGVPPKGSQRFKARLSAVQRGRRDLSLSMAEWSSLSLTQADG